MFDSGFFGLFNGLEFVGGVFCALGLICIVLLLLLGLFKFSVKNPIVFICISVVYWCIVSIYITSMKDTVTVGRTSMFFPITELEELRKVDNPNSLKVIEIDEYTSCNFQSEYEDFVPKEYIFKHNRFYINTKSNEKFLIACADDSTMDCIQEIHSINKTDYWLGYGVIYFIYLAVCMIIFIYKKHN